MYAGRAAAVVAIAAAATACTAAHHLGPAAVQPEASIKLAAATEVHCPAHATSGADGHPTVPLAPIAADRLAPLQTPAQIVVCRYRGAAALQLVGTRVVRSGLATAATELAWLPRGSGNTGTCTAMAGRHTPYLVGLRYPSGVLWVTTAYDVNGCEPTSNGSFTSNAYVGDDVDRAFATGVWKGGVRHEDGGPCLAWPWGRLGQDQRLVPTGATALTICSANGASSAGSSVVHVTRDFSGLTTALDRLRTRPTGNMCDPHGEDVIAYQARFAYAEGPAVVVSISKNCTPLVTNYSLDADGSAQIWAMVDDLAHHPR